MIDVEIITGILKICTKTTKQKYLQNNKKTLARLVIPCIMLKMEAAKQPTPAGGE